MSNTCHYRGNKLDDLAAMAAAGHLFGPDRCGERRVTEEALRSALRVGPASLVGMYVQEGCNPRGAHYTLEGAEYDPTTDVTTATFRPYIDPLTAMRFHGGNPDHQDVVPSHNLAGKDKIAKR